MKRNVILLFVILSLVGCKHNPIDRLLGVKESSNNDTSVPAASSGLTLIVMTPRVMLGDNVVFGVINLTTQRISTTIGPAQFTIINDGLDLPIGRQVSSSEQQITFQPGDLWTDSWKTDTTGLFYVSWGSSTVRDFTVVQ